MKNTFLILAASIILTSCASSSTSFSSFYKENKRASAVSISAPSFLANMFIDKDDVQDVKELFKKIKHYQLLICDNDNNLVSKKFDKFIQRNKYSELLKVNDKGDKVAIYYLQHPKKINEVVLKIKSDDSYVLIGIRAKFKEKDLDKIIQNTSTKISSN